MAKFNFEKLRKHTEYTLNYEFKDIATDDVVDFEIKPVMSDRTKFLEIVSKKNVSADEIVSWFTELALREEKDISEEEKQIFYDFAMNYYGEIQTQTMIGFKLTTKEEIEKRMAEISEKFVEKKLM